MKQVEIFEKELIEKNNKVVGKIAILRGGFGTNNPISLMNEAVSKYVNNGVGFNDFTEITLDNPYVRVIISGINELEFKKLTTQKL